MKKSRVLSLLIVLASLIGFSCKVGLGEAVDTVPPTVTITYPPAGAVVRDAFVLAGDCDDDTGVSSVDIYYERTGTYATEKAMLATVNVGAGEKRWSLTINPNEQDVKDGPYVFYAVARDTQGRTSGTYTQSFEVDNTAPVLILTKPTSYGVDDNGDIKNPKPYGRSVSIEGSFAEATENRIDKLVVTFYNEDGTKVSNLSVDETTFNDITDMSNANPLIIAKLDTTGSNDLLVQQRDRIYRRLYGTSNFDSGAKNFYFTVTAYDKARRFTDPSVAGGTGDGNATTSYYRGTNNLLNLINGEIAGYSAFSVKTIQEYTSGLDTTYADNDTIQGYLSEARVQSAASSVSSARNTLESAENLSSERKASTLNFSMNPANYPTFSVSGLEIGTDDENHVDGYFKYYSGTPLNFAVMAGLDQTKIAVDSVSIYVAKWDPDHSRWMDTESERQLVWTWNPTIGASNPTKYTPTTQNDNADSVSKNVALNFTEYSGMGGNQKWKFIVEGHDISGEDKVIQDYNDTGYGFFATVSTQAASIEIDRNEDKTTNTNLSINSVTKKHDSFTFTGTVQSDGETTMAYKLKITDSSDSRNTWSTPAGEDSVRGLVTLNSEDGTWNVTITPEGSSYISNHTGLYNGIITIYATNGGGTSQQTRTFNIDNDEPSPTLISFKKGEQDVYCKDGVYYLKKVGSNATTYELYGTTIDNYMIDKTEIKLEGKDASGNAKVFTEPKTTSTWYFNPDFTGFAAQTGENNDVTVTISALDKAGNEVEGSITFKVEFDDAAPVAKHELDALGKDLVFRIGDGVGGKYSPGTYGKTTTMKIRGNFEDGEGSSGVKMIYYQVKQSESALTLNTSNYSDESIYTGYFAPLATTKTASVSKNLEGGGKTTVTITTGYEAVLTGFEEGNNYLRLVAVDNVGNAVLDQNYSLNVDLTVPSAESNTSEAFLTNGDNASIGPITGTATDTGSGIGRIDFYVGDSTYKISADAVVTDLDDPIVYGTEYTTSYGSFTLNAPNASGVCNWTLTINNSSKWIKNISSNNINVYANVKDKAGLTTSAVKVATITKDTVKPTISIGDIEDKYTSTNDIEVNGKITTITGTAGDGNALGTESPILYYRTSDPGTGSNPVTSTTGWAQIAAGNYGQKTGTNPWSYTEVDTTTAFGSLANGTPVWIMASIVDKAGNTGYSVAKKIVVDQNTDRPVITFDLKGSASWLQSDELSGTISDDDGIQSFKIYIGDSCPSNWSGIANVTTSTGSWSYNNTGADGTKKIWFYVKDNANTEFISGSTTETKRPYYKFKTDNPSIPTGHYGYIANGAVTVEKDTTPPKFTTTLVTIGENANNYDASSNPNGLKTIEQIRSGDWQSYALKSEKVIGGKKSHFKIYVPICDTYIGDVKADIRDDNNDVETNRYYVNGGPKTEITLQNTNYHFEKDGLVYYYYYGEVIDVSKGNDADPPVTPPTSGVKSVKVTIKDQAGNSIDQTCSFTLDNKGPEVNLMNPKQTDVLTGGVDVSGTSIDGESFVKNTYWMIPNATQRNKTDANLANDAGWLSNLASGSTATSWKFSFRDEYDLTHYDANNTAYVNDVYTLPLYIKSVDDVGNWTIKKFSLKHNPDADKPLTEISYPSEANYTSGNNFVTLGGTIRITGSVSIPSLTTNPEKVYIQIARENGDWGSVDKAKAGTGSGNYGYAVKTVSNVSTDIGKQVIGLQNPDSWWGIEATRSSNAWSFNLNETGSLNPSGAGANAIKIRACGVNEQGKMGLWSDPVYIHIDASTPVYTSKLYKFSGDPAVGTHEVEMDYEPGIYVKGQWYLGLHITDDDKVVFENATLNNSTLDSSKITTIFSNNDKTLDLFIKLDPNATVTQAYRISARDKAEPNYHYIYPSYEINIDNTAPEITAVYKGSTDIEANHLSASSANSIFDTNYVSTLGGKVSENGSGFERIVFYYVRAAEIDGKTYTTESVLDPMVASGSKVAISGLTRRAFTQGSSTYYMYAKAVSGTLGADGRTFSSPDIAGNTHIREGGLIEVQGLLRRITSISSNTVTFDTNTGVTSATSGVTAYFPYAQVVDNTSVERVASESANPFTFMNNTDDGDKMPETLTGSKAMGFTWDATVHSYNMPDGPAALVVLAFDKAGNVNGKTYPVKIENSAPRLAKVFLGTDLNSSNSWETNEFVGYDVYNANETTGIATTEVKATQAISTASYGSPFTIKDKLAVVAEFVGGNGDITMVYGRGATTTAAVPVSGTGAGITATANNTITSAILAADKIGSVNYNNAIVSTSLKGFTLTSAQLVGTVSESNDGIGKKASFTFWDSTDELTPGVNSQNCVLLVNDFTIDLVDSTPPHVVVNPFYWSGNTENSLYGNSSENGHIELESDLTGTQAATSYGTDPKVSGKITFTGTAYDEHKLNNLSFTLTNSSGTALTGFSNIAMATYSPTTAEYSANGGWSALSGNSGQTLANGGKYEWAISQDNTGGEESAGHFEDTYYLGQAGHKVYWTISIDTAQIPNVAQKDIKLTVKAYDGNKYSTDATATATAPASNKTDAKVNHVPSYQFDVVPYITGIKTWLSGNIKQHKEVYARTALGHYPISSGETKAGSVKLQGFNLAAGSADVDISSSVASLTSGPYEYTVGGVKTINNMNNNEAHGSYDIGVVGLDEQTKVSNMYNRTPGTLTNLTLTDDIEFDVWEINRAAAPRSGRLNEPVMRINPSNGMIGFAFANGADRLSLPNGSNNSYMTWQRNYADYSGINFVYDSSGNVHSVSTGLDTEPSNGYAGYMQYIDSRWGGSGTNMWNWNGQRTAALESVGIPRNVYVNGTQLTSAVLDIERFGKPAMGVAGTNRVYLAYYDFDNDQIRFRYGTVGASKTGRTGNNGQFSDDKCAAGTIGNDTGANGNDYGQHKMFEAHTDYYSVLAGKTQGASPVDTGNGTSEYVALDVIAGTDAASDVVVIVWYDGSDLMYTYRSGTKDDTDCSSSGVANKWAEPKVIFEGFGQYCAIKADAQGGIHIAAYSRSGADLYYCYIPGYDQYAKRRSALVDSYSQIGKYISIDAALVLRSGSDTDYNVVPYITYFGDGYNGLPKIAYLPGGINKTSPVVPVGADDTTDLFTGNWEVSLIPTSSEVNEDNLNIALWKTTAGVLKSSNRPNGTTNPTVAAGSDNAVTWYGNGTSKLVLGYGITSGPTGYIETAQMK